MTQDPFTTVRMTVSLDLDVRIYHSNPEYYDLGTDSGFTDIVEQEIKLITEDAGYLAEYLSFNPVDNIRVTQIEIREDDDK